MKMKYKILWFEDDQEYFDEDLQPEIKAFVESKGFIYECVHRKTGAELDNLLTNVTYDLIISDLNLGADETGEKLIDYIRDDKRVLTEVLLYSANEDALKKIVDNKGWIERASFSIGLKNLPAKLRSLIQLSIRKVEDVNNLRGLVIAETIELEKKIEYVLLKFFEATEEQVKTEVKEELRKTIYDKKKEKHGRDLAVIESIKLKDVKDLIDQDILTANNTYETVQSILNTQLKVVNAKLNSGGLKADEKTTLNQRKKHLDDVKKELINFKKEIIDIRNILSHVEEGIDEEGNPFLKSLIKGMQPIKFDEQKYIEVRQNLLKHSENLDLILEHIL
jgi:CheY-like chemotaxis protein